MIQQGPRPAEVMALRHTDVQFETGDIRIPRGKSAAARRILHMTPETQGILERRGVAPDSQWVFPGQKKGTHLVDVENAHQKVLKRARLGFVLYDLRHTFATRFAEVTGGYVVALARILGHSNLRTVMRYVHISEAHTRAAMARFAASRPRNAEDPEEDEK
jgi:integrase